MESEKSKYETSKNFLTDGQLPVDDDFSQSPVTKLPVECLIPIFSLLPIADRVRIQRVCKYWRAVSLKSWSSCKTISFEEKDWGYKYWLGRGIDLTILKKVLQLCGSHVTRIDFSKHHQDPDSNFIKLLKANKSLFVVIKKFCPNLRAIDIRGLEVIPEGLEFLGNSYSTLTEFAINGYEDDYEGGFGSVNFDKVLSLLFLNNTNLRRVILHVPSDGNCLLKLNPITIEDISVMHGLGGEKNICRALKGFINLSRFSITDWSENFEWYEDEFSVSYINEMLKAIEPHAENLKELDISTMDSSPVVIHAKHFMCFENLQKLSLEGQELKIDLITVTKYCTNLTCVRLLDLSVTDHQMASIIQLPKLRELHLWYLDKITDAMFNNHLSSLKVLDCFHCSRLTNLGFCKLLQKSFENLQRLTITECKKVNLYKLIQDVKKAIKTRNTGPLLKLCVKKKALSLPLEKKIVTKLPENLELTEYVYN